MTLYLIRHAQADERGPAYPDDSKRPLVDKGVKQAKALAKALKLLDIEFDGLFSSPYTRAAQTAEPLLACLKKGRHIHYLDSLTDSNYLQLLVDLKEHLAKNERVLALVGHEPYLSDLAAQLLTAKPEPRLNFRKGALLELFGELEMGAMTLEMFLPASVYRKIVKM
ncbi:MAG: phosphohistidine phosphatase SixA [Trueperaceae bacterium]